MVNLIRYYGVSLSPKAKHTLDAALELHRGEKLFELTRDLSSVEATDSVIFYGINNSIKDYLRKESFTFIAIVPCHQEGLSQIENGATDYITENELTEQIVLKSILISERRFESKVETRYKSLVENTSDGIWHHDLIKDELVWSDSLYQILGYKKEKAIDSIRITQLAHPDDREKLKINFRKLIGAGTPYSLEFRIKNSEGKYIWLRAEGSGIRNKEGRVILILGIVKNIEQRKRAEIQLATNKNQIENIAKGIKGVLARHRGYPDGHIEIVYVSPGVEKIWDFDPAQMKENADNLALQLSPEERDKLMKIFIDSGKNNTEIDHTYARTAKDGSTKWLRVKAIPSRLKNGVIEWDSITTDVTHIKKIEEKSEEQKLLLGNIISNIDGAVQRYKIKEDGTEELVFISKGYEKISGIPIAKAKKNFKVIWDQIVEEDRQRVVESIKSSFKNLTPWKNTWRIKSNSGDIKWLQSSGSPIRQDDGSVMFDTVTTEITNLKNVTSQLATSQQEFRLAAKAAKLGLWKFNPVNNSLEWDVQMFKIFGADPKTFTGSADTWMNALYCEDKDEALKSFSQIIENGGDVESQFRIKRYDNGEVRHIRFTASAVKNSEGKVELITGLNWDVTHIVKAQEELAESNKRYRMAAKATQDAVWEFNLEKEELYWNESFKEVFGHSLEGGILSVKDWETMVHPEDLERVWKSFNSFLEEGLKNKWEENYRFRKANGEYAHVIDRGFVTRKLNGSPLKMVGSLRDITARTNFLNAIKEQNDQLRSIAWTQSHELRGPLTRILGLVDLLEEDGLNEISLKEFLDYLKTSSYEMDDVIKKVVFAAQEAGIHIGEGNNNLP